MNNYEDDYLDSLDEAESEFDISDRVIKSFKRESRQKKSDKKKNLKKKIKQIKIDFVDEKE